MYFLLVCIVPTIIIGSISIILSIKSTRESAIKFSLATLDQVQIRVEKLVEEANSVSSKMANDTIIQESLRSPLATNRSVKYAMDLSMDTYLNFDSTYREELYAYYIIGKNGGKYKSAYYSVSPDDLTRTDWYKEISESEEPIWFGPHTDSFVAQTFGQTFLSQGVVIKDKASSRKLGVVLIDIELESLNKMLLDSFGETGFVLIVDEDNELISSSQSTLNINSDMVTKAIHLTSKTTDPYIIDSKNNTIVLSKPLTNNHWRIIGIIPSDDLLKDNVISIYLLIIILIVVCCLSFFLSMVATSTITQPIKNMMALMKTVESGNLDVQMEVEYHDEIGQLSLSFNKMIVQVKNLMQKVYQEQNEQKKYELKALQSQINPHFLYNTLDSIVWLARMQQYEQIVKMVTAITKFFRISISRGKDIISIAEEIDHVANYLMIQKFRYKDKFEYSIDVPEDLHKYKTLKLILQPLVENSIYHGIKMMKGNGDIYIRACEEEDVILFEVEDTGVGITPETLSALHEALYSNIQSQVSIYGIKNVHERIQLFFGKEYGLHFESIYGKGTKAIVKIPKYIGDDVNVKNNYNR
jgi:two-component system sensor histidine kinase YesM